MHDERTFVRVDGHLLRVPERGDGPRPTRLGSVLTVPFADGT